MVAGAPGRVARLRRLLHPQLSDGSAPRSRKGAIDGVQLGNLTGLLAKIRPAVDATLYQGERSAKNYAFVDAVARKNIELTMVGIRGRSAVIAQLETMGAVKIAGAMYNLESAAVDFLPSTPRP
jgi:carbonic anhydrase